MTAQNSVPDSELSSIEVATELQRTLAELDDSTTQVLPGELAVAAAISLASVGTIPRSVTFLAEIVRASGIQHAAELSEPLPTQEQIEIIKPWLTVAAQSTPAVHRDQLLANWLDVVAAVIEIRK